MPELRSVVPTLTETTTPSRRQLVAGLGALSLGSLGILAGTHEASAQDTTSDVDADRFGHGRRFRRRRNRRRNRRNNH
jgi:hypothetical protein